MAEQLSEQLADLSVHAMKAEDTVAAAQKEMHDKIMSSREHARADTTATGDGIARVAADVFLIRDEEEEDGEEHNGDEEDDDVDEGYRLSAEMECSCGILDEMQPGAMLFPNLLNRKTFATELGELDKFFLNPKV